jgi:alkanesulfonate monooxygenase SsuD/methylene tetrahydromethanopterin reductase-like flavin-dependent oxidoreductase (luciferase family)
MAGVPVIAAETDEEARRLATTAQQLFLNLIRNRPQPLPPPVESADALDWNDLERITVEAKMRRAIIGNRERVRKGLELFQAETQVNELMIVTTTYDHEARLRSYEMVAEMTLEARPA